MSGNKRLVVVLATPDMPVDMDSVKDGLSNDFALEIVPLPFGEVPSADKENFWQAIAAADGLLVRTGVVPRALIKRCSSLRVIALHGAGVDQVDVAAATESGIWVTNTPGANARSVVELTLGLIIDMSRGISRADKLVKHGQWERARVMGREIHGQRLGIVGWGNIGRALGHAACQLGMEIVFWNRSVVQNDFAAFPEWARPRQLSLTELFQTSDVVSLHLALTDHTRGLVDRHLLESMKKTALLVNTARGALVVQDDLVMALTENWIGGAALDVFDAEPLPADSPILSLPNVVLTPHLGGSTEECLRRVASLASQDIRRALTGQPPCFPVNSPLSIR